jgi:hypothetical protein
VVDSGIYGIVRHPMYAGAIPFMFGIPLWLESHVGILLVVVMTLLLVLRIVSDRSRWRIFAFESDACSDLIDRVDLFSRRGGESQSVKRCQLRLGRRGYLCLTNPSLQSRCIP